MDKNSKSHWIDVNERLPEKEMDVLFVANDKTMYVGSLCIWETCDNFHYNSTGRDPTTIEGVTHWQPLPEVPKQFH